MENQKTIGIIAGNGRFPIAATYAAQKRGYRVVICAIEKEADPTLEGMADALRWVKIGQLKNLVGFFKAEGVSRALMAGKIEKVRLFQENVSPDFEMVKVLMKTRDFKDDSLLAGVAAYLCGQGIELLDSTTFMKDALPGPGVLGKHKPSKETMADITFGYEIAKGIAGLDIGQTVVVKKKAVLAVEAIEGTDQAVRRGAALGGGGVTMVKVSKPDQDMRFDVPAVGLNTLETLVSVSARAFAFEAGKTLFLDQKELIRRADESRIVLFGVAPGTTGSEAGK